MPYAAKPVGATRLLLVRHGEPEHSARGRCYGKLDVGLSDDGREQIARAGAAFSDEPIAAVYSSPRRRSVESAEIFARSHTLALAIVDHLAEIDFGRFEGLTYDEAEAAFPEIYRVWMERPTEVSFPEGESFSSMRLRVGRSLASIRSTHRGECVAVVSHGGTNRVALADALELPSANIFRLDQSFACVNIVDYFDDTPLVRVVNARF